MLALHSSKRLALTGLCAAAVVLISSGALAQDDDPPPEAGRISYVSGNVSIQPITADGWGQAYPNLPVGPGDRIFTDNDGRAEVQVGQTYVRIGPNSDVTLVDDSQFNINFGVAQGSIRLHSYRLWPRQLLDISTPNGNAEFANSGDLRIDVLPNDGATVFTNLGQFADITAAGDFRQELDYGQSLQLSGSNPVYPQWLQPNGPDDLDSWSQQRDQQFSRTVAFQYVSPDIPGAADLDASGDWQPQTEYGAVWFPRNVSADWEPYHNGHWISRDPWGWVWVEDESWGYAPFHYGRWVRYHDRWGWVPGPVNVRPVWSPALVVFAGGGGGVGVGISAWFPLGPGEAYRPWYRCSPRYVDRVNITNIRESPRVHVQNTYVNVVNVTNVTYVNKTYVTAVRQQDFSSGHSVRNVAVRVDPREVQQMRALQQPVVAAPSRVIINRPVAHPVPVSIQRPMLINQQGKQIAARPNATPVAPPVRQMPAPRPIAGRVVVAAPQRPPQNRPNGNQFPGQGQGEQRAVPPPAMPNVPRANPVKPVTPMQGVQQQPNNQQPNRPNYQQPNQPVPPQPNQRPERPNQPNYQPNRPDQPNSPQPNRPNYQQPNQPAPPQPNQRPERPNQPNYQPERPNQPSPQQPNPQPNRPNYQQPNQPAPPQPNPQQPVRPNPPNYQPERPNQPSPQQPNPQPNRPNYQQPNQPAPQQPNQRPERPNPPNYQQPNQPRTQQPNPPQNPPRENQNRQDFGPVQPNRHVDSAPPPQPQLRPAPPPRDQGRPDPPPQQQNKPNNNKDQKKNDKKEDKKPN